MWTMTKNKALILVFHVLGGTFDPNSLFKGAHLSQKHIIAISAWFEKEVRIVTSQMCPLKQLCAPNHGCRGWKIWGPGDKCSLKNTTNQLCELLRRTCHRRNARIWSYRLSHRFCWYLFFITASYFGSLLKFRLEFNLGRQLGEMAVQEDVAEWQSSQRSKLNNHCQVL